MLTVPSASRELLAGVDVDLVLDAQHRAGHLGCPQLEDEVLAGEQGRVVHPQEVDAESAALLRRAAAHEHAAAADIDLVLKADRHRLPGAGLPHLVEAAHDAGHPRARAAGQHGELVAHVQLAARDAALEAAELAAGAAHTLHGHAEAAASRLVFHLDLLEVLLEGGAAVPRHVLGAVRHVVALGGAHGDELEARRGELGCKRAQLGLDGTEGLLAVAREVHLVHGVDEVAYAHERADAGVAPGLHEHTLGGVDEDDGELGKARPHGHVARVLLVAGTVRGDEGALVGCEVAVGDIDGDALLALGCQAVEQQGVVYLSAAAACLGLQQQGVALVCEQQLGIVEQVAQQSRLAVVDAAAGENLEQALHQKYPSLLRFSMLALPPSRSMTRVVLSEVTAESVSSMTASIVSALDSTAPVRG